jgi:hypothetical protein
MRCSGSTRSYIKFVGKARRHKEQIYEDVDLVLVESLLRLEPSSRQSVVLTKMALEMLKQIGNGERHVAFAPPVCLLLVRFGNAKGKAQLRRCFEERVLVKHSELVRASAIAYATFGRGEFNVVKRSASGLLTNTLALMVKMVRRIKKMERVPDRFKSRLSIRYDSVSNKHYIDMRTFVAGRLLRLNRRASVRAWISQWARSTRSNKLSKFDKKLLRRLTR